MLGVAVLGMLASGSRGDDSRLSPRFVATLMSFEGDASKPAELSVVFIATRPDSRKADDVLRKCLDGAGVFGGGLEIVGKAWFRSSTESSERDPIVLDGGATSLVYHASDKSITASHEKSAVSDVGATDSGSPEDDSAAVLANDAVLDACKALSGERLSRLATVAIESRGERRSQIVRGLRGWCRGNDVNLDKAMSLCVVAISKAAHKEATTPVAKVVSKDPAAISRGAGAFKTRNCNKCHSVDGRGGPRAPDLTDDVWDHCDGSIDGIGKVILSGVSKSKLKDPSRPFAMNPVTGLSGQDLADLASYVHSLRKP